MERRVSTQKNSATYNTNSFQSASFSQDMTHDTGFCTDTEDSKDNLKVMGICTEDSNYNPIVANAETRSVEENLSAEINNKTEIYYDKNIKHKQSSGE